MREEKVELETRCNSCWEYMLIWAEALVTVFFLGAASCHRLLSGALWGFHPHFQTTADVIWAWLEVSSALTLTTERTNHLEWVKRPPGFCFWSVRAALPPLTLFGVKLFKPTSSVGCVFLIYEHKMKSGERQVSFLHNHFYATKSTKRSGIIIVSFIRHRSLIILGNKLTLCPVFREASCLHKRTDHTAEVHFSGINLVAQNVSEVRS